ncbi:hypothetical protein Seregon_BL70054 [Xanthomonas phage Seregon]|nr:hypothetical protein Seregon_BL70054 [Xanthomonas phage Seregon]
MSDMQTTNDLISIIRQRADAGLKKYGVTLDRKDLTTAQWLRHLLEELCDGAGYVLAAERKAIETETAIRAAIQLLALGDTQGAADVLAACLPDGGDGEVVLVRDAGGA